MSDEKYRHAISHMLVAGTTLWCIYNTDKSGGWKWVYGTYGTLCVYSFIGTWRYGNPRYGDDAARLYDFSHLCLMAFALPCAVTDIYLHYGYDWHYSLIHAALPLLPIGMHLTRDEWEQDLVDLFVLGNVISLTAVSVMQDNYYGIVAGLNYAIVHFVLRSQGFSEVPRKVFYNAGLCFYAFYAYRALAEAHMKLA